MCERGCVLPQFSEMKSKFLESFSCKDGLHQCCKFFIGSYAIAECFGLTYTLYGWMPVVGERIFVVLGIPKIGPQPKIGPPFSVLGRVRRNLS